MLDREQEALVAGIADLRGVGVTVGDELLGVATVEALISGLEVDALIVRRSVVVPYVYAELSRFVYVAPSGSVTLTHNSRGSDIIEIHGLLGSIRTSSISFARFGTNAL